MDHRPFEDWLLDDQALTAEQTRRLNAHLRDCQVCSSLAEVNLALKSVNSVKPSSGFTARFHARLEAKKLAVRRRNIWGFVILTLSTMAVSLVLAWPLLDDLIQSPVNLVSSWFSSLTTFWASLQALAEAGLVLFKVAPGFVPSYIWLVILLAAGGWGLVWVVSFIKINKLTQGV